MRILTIDTSANLLSLGVWNDLDPIEVICEEMERGHASHLAPRCQSLLKRAHTPLSSVDNILVNIGPGSFTGIRVGLSFAQGLSESSGIPLSGISSFDAALGGNALEDTNYLIILDARRQDYYCQLVVKGDKHPPQSLTSAEISELIKAYSPILLGNGASCIESDALALDPAGLIKAFDRGCATPARPLYLRQPDVTRAV